MSRLYRFLPKLDVFLSQNGLILSCGHLPLFFHVETNLRAWKLIHDSLIGLAAINEMIAHHASFYGAAL